MNDLYGKLDRDADAERLDKRTVVIQKTVLHLPDNLAAAPAFTHLAEFYFRREEAESLYKRALAIYEKALGPDHPDVATALTELADYYCGSLQYRKAELLLREPLPSVRRRLAPNTRMSPRRQPTGQYGLLGRAVKRRSPGRRG